MGSSVQNHLWLFVVILCGAESALSADSPRVVCYVSNWARWRPEPGQFLPKHIDPKLCTNVVYSFASLDPVSDEITSSDPHTDIDNGFFKNVTSVCRAAGVPVSLSIGGWADSQGMKYSVMLNNVSRRATFVGSVVRFLSEYGFQGLDIDIEYPACPWGICGAGNPKDKSSFVQLLKELHEQFARRNWTLSLPISPDKNIIQHAYDLPEIVKYVDWISIMNYDYNSYSNINSNGRTAPNAPLYSTKGLDINGTVQEILQLSQTPSKFLLGIPFYGQSYTLRNVTSNGYNAEFIGPGKPGKYTMDNGILAYYEVCASERNPKWTFVADKDLGSYAYSKNQWVSILTPTDVQIRVDYAKKSKLGGVMVWELSFDDFNGMFCQSGSYPLLRSIQKALNN